jgi:hypothetical protein
MGIATRTPCEDKSGIEKTAAAPYRNNVEIVAQLLDTD